MHSLKNTFVAVVLLGVSYFVYNGITNPVADPGSEEAGLGLDLEMPEAGFPEAADDLASNAKTQLGGHNNDFSQSLDEFKAPPLQPAPNRQLGQRDFLEQNPQPMRNDFRSQDFQAKPLSPNDSTAQRSQAPLNGALNEGTQPLAQFGNSSQFQPNVNRQPETETQLNPVNPRTRDPNSIDSKNRFRIDSKTNGGEFTSTVATLEMAWSNVDTLVSEQDYRRALATLSQFYGQNNLANDEQVKLLEWLDALAGKVIYSSEHNLAPNAYVIQANDTMQSIADQWGVPAQLVYNVNQAKIANPLTLTPGNELKIIKGPFRAIIDSSQPILTLFLGELYAGRFEVTLLNPPAAGEYRVTSKIANGGNLGSFEVQLTNTSNGSTCSLHASNGQAGSIGLTAGDAQDLFGILSDDSVVTIR